MSKISIAFFLILFILASCTKDRPMANTSADTYTPPVVTPPTNTDTTVRYYLALGDSYTIGQSVNVEDRFPVQTVKYLKEQGFKFTPPEIIAQTGWTTANLISGIASTTPARPAYDIVTLLIGVNNQYQHKSKDEYAAEFLMLLKKAIVYADNKAKRVIGLSIPDYGVTPFASGSDRVAIAKDIDAFNVINKQIADQYGVNYLNITPSTRLAANDLSLVASDGLHPSGVEYKVWAQGLLPLIEKALQ